MVGLQPYKVVYPNGSELLPFKKRMPKYTYLPHSFVGAAISTFRSMSNAILCRFEHIWSCGSVSGKCYYYLFGIIVSLGVWFQKNPRLKYTYIIDFKKTDKVQQFNDLRVLVEKIRTGDVDTEGFISIDIHTIALPDDEGT